MGHPIPSTPCRGGSALPLKLHCTLTSSSDRSFSESIIDQASGYLFWLKSFLSGFLCARKDLSWKSCPTWRGKEQVAVISHRGHKEGRRRGSQASVILKFVFCRGCKHWSSSQSDELTSFCLVHYFYRYLTGKRYKD